MKFKNNYTNFSGKLIVINHIWAVILSGFIFYGIYLLYIHNTAQISPTNTIKAYYDALDFKEFQRAHSYLDPDSDVTIAQYMLEVSVTDGILSSYAKLESIEIDIVEETNTDAKVEVKTEWITPLQRIDKNYKHELVKKNGKWFIYPSSYDYDIPPDQLFSDNLTEFYNHGRRRITTQQTHHQDVLKQPDIEVLSAKLVKFDDRYAVIGEIQNIDNFPADIVVKATLYTEENKELATYNARYTMKHKLLPKEITSFRVDFEGIAWLKSYDTIPKTFNPDEFTPVELDGKPVKFNLQCAGNVATTDLYKNVAISDIFINNNKIQGTLFNYGIQEVTIPQLLVSYYNKNQEILWVEHKFMREGVRIQRKQYFDYSLINPSKIEVINDGMENIYINGIPNKSVANKYTPNRNWAHPKIQLQPIKDNYFSFYKIELNHYIGNPK